MNDALLSEFIFDARDHLGTAGGQLLVLEKNPGDLDSLNTLMGTLHTLKGNSGFLELQNFYHLMHNAETLLQTIREKQIDCPQPVIDLLLQVLDTAEAILNRLSSDGLDTVDWLDALTQTLSEAETKLEEGETPNVAVAYDYHPDDDYSQVFEAHEPAADSGPELSAGPGGAFTLVLADEDLDRAGDRLPAQVEAMFKAGGSALVVDLKGLTSLTARELRLLLAAGRKKPGRTAFLVDPAQQPNLSRLFRVLDPDKRLNLFPDQAPALASFGLSA
ncbi:MAG: Hpt domain-containing protein [Candidatus Adiutrix sp.]|jgi:chemotaxis protein histidine kinase CheA|nr:Hpt domain-containing protein [Candidatus Adiutrix sp.]